MDKEYVNGLGDGSVWYMAQPHSIRKEMAFSALETGRFLVNKEHGPLHCGRFDYVLLYSISGEGEALDNGVWKRCPPETLSIIDCRKYYELRCAEPARAPWCFAWIRFRGKPTEFFYDTVTVEGFEALPVSDPLKIEAEFSHLIDLFEEPGVEASLHLSHAIGYLLTVLADLKLSHSSKRQRHRDTIAKATRYIWEHYTEPLDIDRLAEEASLSKFYFIKLFKEFMDIAPYEYVIYFRVNEAKKYLRATTRKVSEISDAVGFNDECNFIRTFKRITGFTPLQFREHQR